MDPTGAAQVPPQSQSTNEPTSTKASALTRTWDVLSCPLSDITLTKSWRPYFNSRDALRETTESDVVTQISGWQATKQLLGKLWVEDPRALIRQSTIAIYDVVGNIGPAVLTAPFLTQLAQGHGKEATALGVATLLCLSLRDYVNTIREPANRKSSVSADRIASHQLAETVFSRSPETRQSPQFDEQLIAARENNGRVSSFVNRTFALASGGASFILASGSLMLHEPVLGLAILGTGALFALNEARYASRVQKTEGEIADVRRRFWHDRWFCMEKRAIRELAQLGQSEKAINRMRRSERAVSDPILQDAEDHARKSLLSAGAQIAVKWTAIGSLVGLSWFSKIPVPEAAGMIALLIAAEGSVVGMAQQIGRHFTDLKFVRKSLAMPQRGEPDRNPEKTYARLAPGLPPQIQLSDVHVRGDGGKAILNGVSLTFEPGKFYAVCGPSGAGKSTLMKLLTREMHPSHGSITVDDLPLNDIDPDDLRRELSYLPQDFYSFDSFAVWEEIEIGAPKDTTLSSAITNEQARRLAKVDFLGADDQEITRTIGDSFNDGRDFSGGERQRLAIARTFRHNGSIIIADEPTSKLGPNEEPHVINSFRNQGDGQLRTTILISHRYANFTDADWIFYLKDGRVKEEGTHRALMERNGEYAALFKDELRRMKQNE